MLFSVEQAFVGKDEKRAPLKTPASEAILSPMNFFSPLHLEASVNVQHTNPPTVTKFCVLKKLTALNTVKASGPDGIPAWFLKEKSNLLAPMVTDILTFHTWRLHYPRPGKEPMLPL